MGTYARVYNLNSIKAKGMRIWQDRVALVQRVGKIELFFEWIKRGCVYPVNLLTCPLVNFFTCKLILAIR